MLIAQISDCHIRDRASTFGRLVDTTETLIRVVEHLRALDPAPDVVLATGDLTDDGTSAQYSALRSILAPIADRIVPLPGNHDESREFRQAFADLLPDNLPKEHCSYVVDHHPVRLVGLDTTLPGRHDGRFDSSLESWLEESLTADARPTVVFTHFPPFETGLKFMDQSGLADADRLQATISRHPHVRLLVAGHLHRSIQTTINTTLVSICPSTGNQLKLDLHPDRAAAIDEPPAFQLHRWDGERFVTHTGLVRNPELVQTVDLGNYAAEVRRRHEAGEPFSKVVTS
ncbi:MAG: phosphodiesterase [Acidimicrobiales bacterium]|nr:phosphodiesterase [Acidimicrobiales bacterium]